eukprot:g147.t1
MLWRPKVRHSMTGLLLPVALLVMSLWQGPHRSSRALASVAAVLALWRPVLATSVAGRPGSGWHDVASFDPGLASFLLSLGKLGNWQTALEIACVLQHSYSNYLIEHGFLRTSHLQVNSGGVFFNAMGGPVPVTANFSDVLFRDHLISFKQTDLVFINAAIEHVPRDRHNMFFDFLRDYTKNTLVLIGPAKKGLVHIAARARRECRKELLSRGFVLDAVLTFAATFLTENAHHRRNIQVFRRQASLVTPFDSFWMRQALEKLVPDRRLICVTSAKTPTNILLNFLGSARQLHVPVLVIAADAYIFDLLQEIGSPVLHHRLFVNNSAARFSKLNSLRVAKSFLSLGVTFWQMSADIYLCANPWRYFNASNVIQSGQGTFLGQFTLDSRTLQGEFVVYQPHPAALALLDAAARKLQDDQVRDEVELNRALHAWADPSSLTFKPPNLTSSASYGYFPRSSFHTGGCDRPADPGPPVVIHPTCVDKQKEKKQAWIEQKGVWGVSKAWEHVERNVDSFWTDVFTYKTCPTS